MFLPGIILLTQCYYHRGTRLNAMKRFCICSLWSLLNVLTFFSLDWGMLRRSRRVQLFLSKNSTGTICIAWLHLQEGHFIFICFAPLHVHPCPCNVRISTEYLYSEHALKVRWMHSHPTAGKINPNHPPQSLCCCSTVQERLRSVWFVLLTAVVYQQYKHSYM